MALTDSGKKKIKKIERRFQTLVFKAGLANSIHHAGVLIRDGRQAVNVPSMVRVDSQTLVFAEVTAVVIEAKVPEGCCKEGCWGRWR